MTDVLVIGAGPAGLAAAAAAREAGGTVTLLDSSDLLGGQYWRHLPSSRPAERERSAAGRPGPGRARGACLGG